MIYNEIKQGIQITYLITPEIILIVKLVFHWVWIGYKRQTLLVLLWVFGPCISRSEFGRLISLKVQGTNQVIAIHITAIDITSCLVHLEWNTKNIAHYNVIVIRVNMAASTFVINVSNPFTHHLEVHSARYCKYKVTKNRF